MKLAPLCFRSPSRLLALGLFAFLSLGGTPVSPLSAAPRVTVTLSGLVTDLSSGQTLPGASIRALGQQAESDLEGRFHLDLPPGRHRLRITAPGYGSATVVDQTVRVPLRGAPGPELSIALPPLQPDAPGLRAMADRLRNEPELSADLRGLQGPAGGAGDEEMPVSVFADMDPEAVPAQIRVLMPDGQIVAMDTDSYLKGVVPAEMGYLHRRAFAALMAQAIASRTYAAVRCLPASAGDPQVCEPGLDANVDTTTRTQVWRNVHYDITDAAVEATHGQVARLDGKLLNALFFARTTERTLASEESRCCGGRAWSYLRSVSSPDPFAEPLGHGAGLSQEGAATLADWGAGPEEIMEHYYRGARVALPQAPHLFEGEVLPREGPEGTRFGIGVGYVSWDNLPPTLRQVWIDDTAYVMSGPSGPDHDYRAGATYRFEAQLPQGRHRIRFQFSDGSHQLSLDGGEVTVSEAPVAAAGTAAPSPSSPAAPAREDEDPVAADNVIGSEASDALDGSGGSTTLQPADGAEAQPVPVRSGSIRLTPAELRPQEGDGSGPGLGALSLDLYGSVAPELAALTLEGPVVQTEFPFMAVGLRLDGQVPAESSLDLALRSSRDGVIWSPWLRLGEGDGDAPESAEGGPRWTQLLIVRGRFLQSRVILAGPRDRVSSQAAGVLSSLELHYINSDNGPGAPLSPPAGGEASLGIESLTTGTGGPQDGSELTANALTVIPRAGWGADESKRRNAAGAEIWPPTYTVPRAQLVHHTVTTNDPADPAAVVRAIYQYHAVSQGWGDIGYNFLVDHRGNIYEGRHGGEQGGKIVQGGHALQYNPNTIGVALLGTFTAADKRPSEAMERAAVELLATKGQRYAIQPDAPVSLANARFAHSVMGHRDALPGHTQCPGDGLYGRLEAMRTAVRVRMAELAGQPGAPPPPTAPAPTAPPPPTPGSSGCAEALGGGDFEQEDARWQRNRAYYTGWQAYQGSRAMFVGLRDNDTDQGTSYASVQQSFRLPARLGTVQLRFAAQTVGDAADQRVLRIVDGGGRTVALGNLVLPPSSSWQTYTADLSRTLAPHAGRELRFYVGVINNGYGRRSYLRLDAVSLSVCEGAGSGSVPEPTDAATAIATEETPAATAAASEVPSSPEAPGPTSTPDAAPGIATALATATGGSPVPSPGGSPLCGPLLREGFEEAGADWKHLGGHPVLWASGPAASGAGVLRLGLADAPADSFDYAGAARRIALPKGVLSATLQLQLAWERHSPEDRLLVEVRAPERGWRQPLLVLPAGAGEPSGAWQGYRLPLDEAWLGLEGLELYLALLNRGQREVPGGVSTALVDELRLDACWRPGLAWLPLLRRVR